MISTRRRAFIVAWFAGLWLWWPGLVAAQSMDVFQGFTGHIERQIKQDKQYFVNAQTCTEWFYQQQRKPGQPKAEGIALSEHPLSAQPALQTSDCPARYPGGLNAAREDFSSTQSALSLSLTFYQFALVGDRNDDERYNAAELQDMLASFGLSYDGNRPASVHVTALTTTFDSIRKAGGLERLMTSMGRLFDKGYRLTSRDRSALDQISK